MKVAIPSAQFPARRVSHRLLCCPSAATTAQDRRTPHALRENGRRWVVTRAWPPFASRLSAHVCPPLCRTQTEQSHWGMKAPVQPTVRPASHTHARTHSHTHVRSPAAPLCTGVHMVTGQEDQDIPMMATSDLAVPMSPVSPTQAHGAADAAASWSPQTGQQAGPGPGPGAGQGLQGLGQGASLVDQWPELEGKLAAAMGVRGSIHVPTCKAAWTA